MTSARSASPTGSITEKLQGLSLTDKMTEPSDTKKDKVKVDFFYGDRPKLRAYLVQLKLVYALNKDKYPDSPSKVMLAAVYLRGAAFSWFEPYVSDYLDHNPEEQEPDTKKIFAEFSVFEEKLK
jgi:hypothetical protein